MSAPDFELSLIEIPFPVPAAGAPLPFGGPGPDDRIVVWPEEYHLPEPEAEEEASWGWKLVSAIANFHPIFGRQKNLIEGLVGSDLITGEGLANWERALNIAAAIPVPHDGGKVVHVIHTIHTLVDAVHVAHHAKHLGEVIVEDH